MRSRLLLEYDGGEFVGWASQPGLRTVQGEVERALAVVLGRPVPVVVAGRTDTGVHALGQVCSYDGEAVDPRSLNGLLPADVAVLACEPAGLGFDARRDATSRAYCYRVLARRARSALRAGRVLHWPHVVDVSALEACASLLVGVHDFTAFTPTETEHVRFEREVYAASWERVSSEDELVFWIEADSFMRHMNRVLVGTMLEVAGGRRTVSGFASLLRGGRRAGTPARPPRPMGSTWWEWGTGESGCWVRRRTGGGFWLPGAHTCVGSVAKTRTSGEASARASRSSGLAERPKGAGRTGDALRRARWVSASRLR